MILVSSKTLLSNSEDHLMFNNPRPVEVKKGKAIPLQAYEAQRVLGGYGFQIP
jgi:hypothetical protein